jgi:Meiosis protein SPO22/ZIP4 like.
MYTQAKQLHHFLTAEYAEKLADVLYEIGKSLSSQNDFVTAVKWLERANEIINGPGLEGLSREGIELRLAILQALITTLLGTGVPEDFEKAKQLVDFIESENGNKFVVLLLKLELLQKKPAEIFDAEAYADVLQHIIRNFASSESGFKLVMHHIRKLHTKSPGAACTVLDDFMLMLSKMDKRGWMEKGVVMRIWMITNQRDSVDTIETVKGVFSQLSFPLGPEAAVAAQAVGVS